VGRCGVDRGWEGEAGGGTRGREGVSKEQGGHGGGVGRNMVGEQEGGGVVKGAEGAVG